MTPRRERDLSKFGELQLIADAIADIAAACESLDLPTAVQAGSRLSIDGVRLGLNVVVRSHPNAGDIARVVDESAKPAMLVADRISDAGRQVLRAAGWSFLDRRGHLRIWKKGLRIDSDFVTNRPDIAHRTRNPWTQLGLEVALAALCEADQSVSARRLAQQLGRSPGSIHELVARFTEEGLIGPKTRKPLLPDFFFELVARWPDDEWIPLPLSLFDIAERFGVDHFIRVDERAATLGGAKIAAAASLAPRCYVDSPVVLRRLRSIVDRSQPAVCFVRASPTRWIPELEGFEPHPSHPWRVAHPVLCAVRLAKDAARGREIVGTWGIIQGVEA